MILNLQNCVVQWASTFFHQHGMEPAISLKDGTLEVNQPENMSNEEFSAILSEMAEHIRLKVEGQRGG